MATVLVIDDEIPIVDLLVDLVEEQGHAALRADNGLKGLVLARERRPDLIISDIMMPVLDGYGLVRALRADPELAPTKVVLVSAGFSSNMPIAGAPPATAYLRKPFDIAQVEQMLSALLSAEIALGERMPAPVAERAG